MNRNDSPLDTSFLDDIMRAAQLAACLEVSGTPKPGNVHRFADFPDTRFEQFLAGSVALGPAVKESAYRGLKAGRKEIGLSEIGIGSLIKRAVTDVKAYHRGGNTHLGVSFLFIPLAASAGLTHAEQGELKEVPLRKNVIRIVERTSYRDAQEAYDAILLATSAALGRLVSQKAPDLCDPEAKRKIEESNTTLFDLMKLSAPWDNISKEWSTGMEACFGKGCATFSQTYNETHDVNTATVHTFLTLLCEVPDTFIARKVGVKHHQDIEKAVQLGLKESLKIAQWAKESLVLGGMSTEEGRATIEEIDRGLRDAETPLNPGTTADLTAGSIMIALLLGFKP